jgi:hypothetical protein
MHISEVPQQLFGSPSDVHALVPSGHLKSRANSAPRGAIRKRGSKRLDSECGRNGDIASNVPFPRSAFISLVSDRWECASPTSSPANIQLSSMNISPGSTLIFLTPIGFSFCSLSYTLRLRLTCASSSGKYLVCLGRLCGHCGSEATGKARRKSRVGGRARRLERCIVTTEEGV